MRIFMRNLAVFFVLATSALCFADSSSTQEDGKSPFTKRTHINSSMSFGEQEEGTLPEDFSEAPFPPNSLELEEVSLNKNKDLRRTQNTRKKHKDRYAVRHEGAVIEHIELKNQTPKPTREYHEAREILSKPPLTLSLEEIDHKAEVDLNYPSIPA